MANVYAVKSGNWSDTTVWNTGALPTSADDVYSNNFTVTIDQNVNVLTIRNSSATGITAGGGFILNAGFTITLTASVGLSCGSSTSNLLTFSASGTSTIIGNVGMPANGLATTTLVHSGSGTLNITGNILGNNSTGGSSFKAIVFSGSGIINVIGDIIYSFQHDAGMMTLSGTGTFNQLGNIYLGTVGGNSGYAFDLSNGTYNLTGNITANLRTTQTLIRVTSLGKLYVTGNVTMQQGIAAITNSAYLNIIGTITASETANTSAHAVISSTYTSINIFSGPFISSTVGYLPIYVLRMHLIPNISSYYEYRDNSTNGALPPATPAPATRLVSPAYAVDAPIPANVRKGVKYALNTFTGTLEVPSPDSVAKGVPTDNTVGNAVLTPDAVWNHLVANINTANSIGERLKNAATVETTGAQIAAFNG